MCRDDNGERCEAHTFSFEFCPKVECTTFADVEYGLNVALGIGFTLALLATGVMAMGYRRRLRHYSVAAVPDNDRPIVRWSNRGVSGSPTTTIQMNTLPTSVENQAFSFASSSSGSEAELGAAALNVGLNKMTRK